MEHLCVYYLALQDSQSFMFAFKMSMCHFQFWPQKLHFLQGRTTYDMTCCTNTNACEKIIYPSIHQFVSFSTPLEDQNLWELNRYCEPLHSHVSSLSGLVYCFSRGSCFSPVVLHFPSLLKPLCICILVSLSFLVSVSSEWFPPSLMYTPTWTHIQYSAGCASVSINTPANNWDEYHIKCMFSNCTAIKAHLLPWSVGKTTWC